MHIFIKIEFVFSVLWLSISAAKAQSLPQFDIKMDSVFYIGNDNKIQLNIFQTNAEDVSLKINNNLHPHKLNDSLYILRINSATSECKVKLYYKNILVDIKDIVIKNLPQPIDSIAIKGIVTTNYSIPVAELHKITGIFMVRNKEYPSPNDISLISFFISIINEYGIPVYSTNLRSENFPVDMINVIKKLQPGSQIVINNIYCHQQNKGQIRLGVNSTFTVD